MALEVELKAPCSGAEEKVKALGAVFVKSESQEDTYYTHPCRDFRKTDEALRIRKTDGLLITYKGPKKRSDVKAREEIEFPVPNEAHRLLEVLGFRKAFTVSKKRKTYRLNGLTVCCDHVKGLGEYVEVESLSAGDRVKILDVLERLGVSGEATTRTYAELLNL